MKMIMNSLIENQYIRNCKDTIFTMLLREAITQNPVKTVHLKNSQYIHGLLSYPPRWETTTDIFQYIKPEHLNKLQNSDCYFVFDSSTEGFSPIYEFPFFDMLYFNCQKYNVSPSKIIFVSSNLRDENTMAEYAKKRRWDPINVFSFLSFEQVITIDEQRRKEATKLQFEMAEHYVNKLYEGKYFSSLSRVYRHYRSVATFLLCHSPVRDKAIISHGKIPKKDPQIWLSTNGLDEFTEKQFVRWTKKLPLIADRKDFEKNWAINTPYRHIHDTTLFQIVNETLVQDWEKTTLFYSEKSFRPIAHFQPFIIYGQQGCNRHLREIGYHTYEDWFDLSFDDESDPVLRYRKLLKSIEDLCARLDGMDRKQQIEWRFKNNQLLIDNFTTMVTSSYSRKKLLGFVTKICNDLS